MKRNGIVRHKLQLEAVRLREEGLKQEEIRDRLNETFKLNPPISQSTVSRYLSAAKSRYIQQTDVIMARQIHREKSTLDYVEEEARQVWEEQREVADDRPDSNLLKRMLEASDRRARLLRLVVERSEVDHKGGLVISADRLAAADKVAADEIESWEKGRFGE